MTVWRCNSILKNFMLDKVREKPLLVILGATGTGKSKLAVDIALRYNGEIINGDAMQMYEGLPVITNKATLEERKGVPHHLFDCIKLTEPSWTVSHFVHNATETIEDINKRGKLPILVGGTHYYTQGVLFRDSLIRQEGVENNSTSHHELTAEHESLLNGPTDAIYEKLQQVDPKMSERWHPRDRRRIQRSLEIWLEGGTKASDLYTKQKVTNQQLNPLNGSSSLVYRTMLLWTYMEQSALNIRLSKRVDEMLEKGLISEASQLYEDARRKEEEGISIDKSRGIWVSIGLKEFENYIKLRSSGVTDDIKLAKLKDEAVERVKISTSQYAKYQLRWIRSKLASALSRSACLDSLYLFDLTGGASGETKAFEQAFSMTDRFLEDAEMPHPTSLSSTARKILGEMCESLNNRKVMVKRECKLCDKIMITDDEWERHMKGRVHRRNMKRLTAREGPE